MPAYTTRGTPLTYIINYQDHLSDIPASVAPLHDAPPALLHCCNDMPYLTRVGASSFKDRHSPMPWAFPISPAEAKERARATKKWVDEAHAAGVKYVIPYICNQTLGGDPEKRLGIWWFYDRWEQYADDVGANPPVDPIEWMQREDDGGLHFNYPHRFVKTDPPLRYAPCPNNPYWHDWLKRIVGLIASYGYDGTFIDNNIMHCRCEHCQNEFRVYLHETYTDKELRDRFGTANLEKTRLAMIGDILSWSWAHPEYPVWLRDKDPGVFKEVFGTDDPKKARMSEGGTGLHWGRSYTFWLETLEKTLGREGTKHALRVGDVSSLGVTTARQLCLWADTQKFWAWTIGRRNAELRDVAEEARGEFLIVPNWGDMTGFRHIMSRCRDAKNVRLWKPGADLVFFEDEYLPGTIAPGFTFDLMVSYKYSAACGSRSCVLPYRGADSQSLTELATAEAATWSGDGAFIQMPYSFPEIRSAYRGFYESHAEWYKRRESHADIGLVLSFDEVHMENTYHLRESYACARYLAEQHVLFDFLTEGQITFNELARFEIVIVPHVEYLPISARRALLRYLERGGRVLVTGNTGVFDEHGKAFTKDDTLSRIRSLVWRPGMDGSESLNYSAVGRIVWLNDIFRWIPERIRMMHDIGDATFEELTAKVIPSLGKRANEHSVADTRLADILDGLAGRRLSVLGEAVPTTLRVSAWARHAKGQSIVLHLLNYDVPGPGLPAGPHVPVENIQVRLPVGEKRVSHVVAANPWTEAQELRFRQREGMVSFVVPKVDIYLAIRLE